MRTLNILLLLPLLALQTSCGAQIKNARTVTVRIDGDCPMCEKTIEAAALVKNEATADWDVDAKTAVVTFDSTRTTLDAVLQRIALAGYDSEHFLAPDVAYAKLPGCCQYERAFKPPALATTDHAAHTGHDPGATPADAHQAGSRPVSEVLDHYFALKDALVASNAAMAQKHAGELDGAMHSVDPEALPEDLRKTWTEVMTASMPILHPLSETDDLAAQRDLFAKLTAPMALLAKAAPGEAPIYLDHCPMYNEGADWLSRDKAIKNPFYGSRMLTCGSVKETITK